MFSDIYRLDEVLARAFNTVCTDSPIPEEIPPTEL